MHNYFLINNFAIVLIDMLGVWLALWVYFADKKEKANKGFFYMVITILFWINFYHLATLPVRDNLSLILFKIAGSSVFLFFISYYFFIIRWFLEKKGIYKILGRTIFLYGLVFSFITIATDFIIKTSRFEYWGAYPVFTNAGWFIFYGYVIFLTVTINIILLANYVKSDEEKKLKIQYFLIGMIIFAGLNFIFNVIFPVLSENYKLYQFGNYSAIFLLGFTAYAIVRQKLFGVKTVLTTFLVGLIAVLLILDFVVFSSEFDLQILIIKGSTIITFIFFGLLLIRSVIREIHSREEKEELVKKLEAANLKLKELDQAKSDFISIASHQLRTPLTAIKGYSSMALEGSFGEISDKVKDAVSKIFQSSQRLVLIISDFLDISRIEQGTMNYEFKSFELNELMENLTNEFKSIIDKNEEKSRKLKISFDFDKNEDYGIIADRDKIRQILSNLIDNAVKYTREGFVKISLTKNKENGATLVKVLDSGMGIAKEIMPNLFKKFGRAKNAINMYANGSGLGLYVAKEIIKAHHGKIWAESEGENKGSTFFVELPIKTS